MEKVGNEDNLKVIEMINMSKAFGGVQAVKNVNFSIKSGEIHALVGENGAGKTTLMNILGGVVKPDSGKIILNKEELIIDSPHKAQGIGISFIHQELPLIDELSISKNIYLGLELIKGPGWVNSEEMNKNTIEMLKRFDIEINPNILVEDLSTGQKQIVEVCKSLISGSWVIIMDEPTSALTEGEKDGLFKIINKLKNDGVAVIFITHRMPEIFELSDIVTVMRDGENAGTLKISETSENEVIKLMIGHELGEIFTIKKKSYDGEIALEVKNLSKRGVFENVDFNVRKGEIVGLGGLMGSGRTEIAKCIYGLDKADEGKIYLNSKEINIKSTLQAIGNGIVYIPEDRRKEGIFNSMNVKDNLSIPSLPWYAKRGFITGSEEKSVVAKIIKNLNIKVSSMEQEILNLSGGNQQKVSLGKFLALKNVLVLIFDEPTRGIDVGAKTEIYKIISDLAFNGIAVLMISSDLDELIGISDRIVVLRKGKKVGEFTKADKDIKQRVLTSITSGIVYN